MLKFSFYFNRILFSIVLLVITITVLMFVNYYMSGEPSLIYFIFFLVVFVGRIFSLVLSWGALSMLVSWDLLGISRFFLVLFYNNWDRCSGAINTVLTNRFGDYFLFIFFSGALIPGLGFASLSFFFSLRIFMLFLAAFTKRAIFPFSRWLPKAMRAPTPVRALVHRRTLVTAGLMLVMNFGFILKLGRSIVIMSYLGVLTISFSRLAALVEEDIKKVVALSTLSQMGFSMLTVGLGLMFVSYIHLVRHALFKSCLFLQVGYMIHTCLGQQDGRGYRNLGNVSFFMQVQLLITLFCLCGLFFTSGSVRKDYILEIMFSNVFSFIFGFIFFFGVFLTFMYSLRLWKRFTLSCFFSLVVPSYSLLFCFLSLLLSFFSVVFLWWLSANMFLLPVFFLYVDFFVPLFFLILLLLFFFYFLKLAGSELGYKFLVDFFVKYLIQFLLSFKFFDVFLGKLNYNSASVLGLYGYGSLSYIKSFYFNSLVFLIFFLCLIIWGFSLKEF